MISTLSDISLLSNQGTNQFKKKNKISFDIKKKKKLDHVKIKLVLFYIQFV